MKTYFKTSSTSTGLNSIDPLLSSSLEGSSSSGPCLLSSLKQGQKGIIDSVECGEEIRLKLLEMGIAPGEEIQFIRKSPFGDPLEYELMHFRIALRKSEADKILLKPIPKSYL